MSRAGRRKHGAAHGSDHPDERWMASYLDMITVLMCLFIVLYAMSNVDKGKYEELKDSLSAAFGREVVEGEPVLSGGVDEEGDAEEPEVLTDVERAVAELQHLRRLQAEITKRLESRGLHHLVEFGIDARGLSIKLVGSETFFDGNSAALRAEAEAVLKSVAPVLQSIDNQVTIEGHADPRGNPAPFPTDWELSSSRATAVLRNLVESGGVAPARISSVGFGSSRPVATAGGAAAGALNRRVDIVVLSQEPEAIRGLIPELIEKEAQAKDLAQAKAEEAAAEKAAAEEHGAAESTTEKHGTEEVEATGH
ncbi:flagellar motor protein MotB [Lysobacter korlensis]|uniref:Flagellar motor protein MotB n=1 Tax=Lysobacter korlensis TaxID=553636 RepID=A0ABV6RUP7_9GAMM